MGLGPRASHLEIPELRAQVLKRDPSWLSPSLKLSFLNLRRSRGRTGGLSSPKSEDDVSAVLTAMEISGVFSDD